MLCKVLIFGCSSASGTILRKSYVLDATFGGNQQKFSRSGRWGITLFADFLCFCGYRAGNFKLFCLGTTLWLDNVLYVVSTVIMLDPPGLPPDFHYHSGS